MSQPNKLSDLPLEIAERSRIRRERMSTHKADSFGDAEAWDLAFWQAQGPEARLSALVALREDLRKVVAAREEP